LCHVLSLALSQRYGDLQLTREICVIPRGERSPLGHLRRRSSPPSCFHGRPTKICLSLDAGHPQVQQNREGRKGEGGRRKNAKGERLFSLVCINRLPSVAAADVSSRRSRLWRQRGRRRRRRLLIFFWWSTFVQVCAGAVFLSRAFCYRNFFLCKRSLLGLVYTLLTSM